MIGPRTHSGRRGSGLFIRRGFSLWDVRSTVGRLVAQTVLSLAVPRAAKQMPTSAPLTADVMAEARAHFAKHCAICHANEGSGRTRIGQTLSPIYTTIEE